jgi:hypothetical protein
MDYSKSLILHWNGKTWKQAHSPSPAGRTSLTLRSVTATSARNAWAAGYSNGKTLIERWNGITWKQVPSPSPASDSYLFGVAAASARNVWAAGATYHNGRPRTLIMHWNGTAWK